MSDLWFWGSIYAAAVGGFQSPDPPSPTDTSWTWEVDYSSYIDQKTYARTSLNSVVNFGGGYFNSGIVTYTTQDIFGVELPHPVGQSDPNGLVDFIADNGVVSVTFGWEVGADGGFDLVSADVNMEIWIL
jgi:hypothetical protein